MRFLIPTGGPANWQPLLAEPDKHWVKGRSAWETAHPDEARTLLHRYGHRFRDPAHPSTQFSMSAYLAARLGELAKEGALRPTWGRATGPWSHNGVISHWDKV